MEKEKTAAPIKEVRLQMMAAEKAAKVDSWLTRLHCTMTYMSPGFYVVHFPEGATEEVIAPPRPQYQEESIIILSSYIQIRKVKHWPCHNRPGCTHIELLPIEVPKPEQEEKAEREGSKIKVKE